MALKEKENKILLNENGLYFKEFLITNNDIIGYFENLPESENLEEPGI